MGKPVTTREEEIATTKIPAKEKQTTTICEKTINHNERFHILINESRECARSR